MSPLRQAPQPERLRFDAPILSEPHASAAVIWQGTEGESVSVVGFDSSYAILDLDGVTGYVRQDAVGQGSSPSDQSRAPRTPVAAANPTRTPLNPEAHAYPGVVTVAGIFVLVAWVVLIGGIFMAMLTFSSYDCTESLADDCSDEGTIRLLWFVVVAAAALIYAAFFWAVAYGLLLLDRIELNSRQRSRS